MQTVIDNILLNYEILGSKNKNVILILHGWKNSIKNWEEIGKKLASKNKIILLDLPGMGNSSLPKDPFDIYDYANLIAKFIEKLQIKNITLLGHSFGGKIAVVISSKNSGIKKLILVDISGIKNNSILLSTRIFLAKITKYILPKKMSTSFSSEDYKSAGNLIEIFKKIVVQDISKEAKKITIPSLIIWGENDKEVPVSSGQKLKSLIKNSTLRIVWKASHHPHLEKPEKFLEIVQEFI